MGLAVVLLGRHVQPLVMRAPFLLIPLAGLVVAGLAILFTQVTDKGVDQVLFSGQDAIGPLAANPARGRRARSPRCCCSRAWRGAMSLGAFRGGPTFPAMFLGVAAGVLASHLPGFDVTPAAAVGMGAGVVAVLRLPLSAVVLATLLTTNSGVGDTPLIIVGVVVAYVVTLALAPRLDARPPSPSSWGSRPRRRRRRPATRRPPGPDRPATARRRRSGRRRASRPRRRGRGPPGGA